MSLAIQLRTTSADFQNLQLDMEKAIDARQKLDAQLSENELVQKEFTLLTSENTIYKKIGPVLVKQDITEAKSNVSTRLDFIRSEMKRVESQIKEIEGKQGKKKQELVVIQTAIQQQNAGQGTPSNP